MSILSEDFDLTPQDIIKNAVVKLLTKYDDDPNSVNIIWESCDWPRIVKRPDKNVITYYHPHGKLFIHIHDRNKYAGALVNDPHFNYRTYTHKFNNLPLTIEDLLNVYNT